MSTSKYEPTDLLLSEIIPDPSQPRRYFDPLQMQELTKSVEVHGILQSITVRPTKGGKFMIVFGERRWRAACNVMTMFPERNTIPVVIKEISDQEALVLQIVENLQRKNVHPLEEAESFKILHVTETLEEIAHRAGKSPGYVAQRVQLCKLTPAWKDILYENKMKLKTAFTLARLPYHAQEQIYEDANIPGNWKEKQQWELPDWVNTSVKSCGLQEAPFDTTDPNLYPAAGACTTCPYNSQANQLIFPDMQNRAVCNNAPCFSLKLAKAFQQRLESMKEDPTMLFVNTSRFTSQNNKQNLQTAEQMGVHILDSSCYEQLEVPEKPPTWEEYLETELEYIEEDEYPEEELLEFKNSCKEDYDRIVARYEQDLVEHQQVLQHTNTRKAFVVSGPEAGTVIDIILTDPEDDHSETSEGSNNVALNPELLEVERQIKNMLQRAARNQELDREKIYKNLLELYKPEDNPYLTNDGKMSREEYAAFLFTLAIESACVNDLIREELKVDHDYYGLTMFNAILEKQTANLIHKAIRLFITSKLISATDLDYGKNGKPAAIYTLGKQYFPTELAAIEHKQNQIAVKRGENADKRLKKLQARKEELVNDQVSAAGSSSVDIPEEEFEPEFAE